MRTTTLTDLRHTHPDTAANNAVAMVGNPAGHIHRPVNLEFTRRDRKRTGWLHSGPCPHCGAPPMHRCVTANGRSQQPHAARTLLLGTSNQQEVNP